MCHSVVVKIRGCGKTLAAKLTNMRLLARVNAAVGIQAAGRAEALLTEITDVRPFAGVYSHVPFQQARPVENFAASVARQHAFGLWSQQVLDGV